MALAAVKSTADKTGEVQISAGSVVLNGELLVPNEATGIVLFAHGSGSSRFSPRNQYVARVIRELGVGTLLFDLLTREEEAIDIQTRHLRFDISLLAQRLVDVTHWLEWKDDTNHLRPGYFGSSTGGGAALVAADTIRQVMWDYCGIDRSAKGLRLGHAKLTEIESRLPEGATEEVNMVQTSLLIADAAQLRKESRGGHYRSDFPRAKRKWSGKHIEW